MNQIFFNQLRSPNTKKSYEATITKLLTDYPQIETATFKVARQQIRAWLEAQDGSYATRSQRLFAIRSYFQFLLAEDIREDNPANGIKLPNQEKTSVPDFPTPELIELVIAKLREDKTPVGKRNLLIGLMLQTGGFRISELLALTPNDIDQTGKVKIHSGKGNKWRITGIAMEAVRLSWDWVATEKIEPDERIFDLTVRGVEKMLARTVNDMPELSQKERNMIKPHGFRHAWATQHVRNNTPTNILLLQGGWSSDRMIQHYVVKDGVDVVVVGE